MERIIEDQSNTHETSGGVASSKLPRQYGELRWTARAKETSSSVFLSGQYSPPIQALLEFTDNSVGYRDRTQPLPTIISVFTDKDRVSVTDFGGLGANAEGIKRFAQVGVTEDMGIGFRGAGAKYAAWYFGEDLAINAKKQGEEVEYRTRIEGFGDPTIEYKGTFAIDAVKSPWDKSKGRFEITVRRLKNPDLLPYGSVLRRVLGEVYRPLLPRRKIDPTNPSGLAVRFCLDEESQACQRSDKIVLFVTTTRKREQVEPLVIPLLPEYSEENLQKTETSGGENIWFWAGEMDLKDGRSRIVKPGMRFYYDGRLIMINYCDFDSKDLRLAGVTGEVHLDNIKGIKEQLTVNKSAGINTQSEQWKRVSETMHQALVPFVAELQKKPVQMSENLPTFLAKAMAQARKLVDLSVKELAIEGSVITPEDLAILVGETYGQRSPKPPSKEGKKPRGNSQGKKWEDQKGRTIPDQDAEEEIKRIRKSYIDGDEWAQLDDPIPISQLVEVVGENGKKRRLLRFNTTNPFVTIALLEGELAIQQLVAFELIEHMARDWYSNLEDFIRVRGSLRFKVGKLLTYTPAYLRLEAKRLRESSKAT